MVQATVAPAIEATEPKAIVVPVSTYQSKYVFEGHLGTFSRVEHTKAEMTKAENKEPTAPAFQNSCVESFKILLPRQRGSRTRRHQTATCIQPLASLTNW